MASTTTIAPSGTVTFLFTDIEGSTNLWENHPELMRTALARHDELMRQAIGANAGAVFKTIGDAFCATFPSASAAISATAQAQRALFAEPWPAETQIKVRMAVHTGPAEARDNDFFGQTVNRVARILAVAHGGQTVLSESAYHQVQEQVPDSIGFIDLGVHRLKDLVQPEHVYQVLHPELPSRFPPLRSLESSVLPNNLPAQLTSFVGRQKELEKVAGLVTASRIVTLTGSGGCGKTRLAVQTAAEVSDRFPDGIWFADLAPVTDPELVVETVAAILGVREEPGRTLLQTLTAHSARKRQLFVLDNCEHLLTACAKMAETVLRSCPEVRILATSREALNISGETTFRVPSLGLPDPRNSSSPDAVAQFESVRLFVERAQAVVADFAVGTENFRALAGICQRLDGIPLAIELAAARVRSLSPEQIATRLDDRFRLLTSGSRSAMPRQQTLRALVDWSYDLLTEPERALLRRLSLFSGGWTLDAAEEVASGEPVEDWEVLDLMSSLVDKSLVMFEPGSGAGRYRLLETVKRYGQEKVRECDEAEATLCRHMAWFARLASESESWVRGPKQKEWLDRLEPEQDNLWLALETSRVRQDVTHIGPLSWTLGLLFEYRGFLNEAVKAIDAGLGALEGNADADPLVTARLRYERAGLHQDFGEADDATALASRALAQFEASGEATGAARAENLLGQIAMGERSFEEAQRRFETSLDGFRNVGDNLGVAIVLNNLGVLARRNGQSGSENRSETLSRARTFLLESLTIRRDLNDLMGEAETLNNLGVVAFEREDLREAWDHYRNALHLERELKRTSGIGTTLANLGEVAGVLGDREAALRLMSLAERVLDEVKSPLAGAVRSMFLDMAEDVPQEVVAACVSAVHGPPLDECLEQAARTELSVS